MEAPEKMLSLENQTPSTPSGPSVSSVPSVPNLSIANVPGPSTHTASVSYRSILECPRATNQAVPAKKLRLERSERTSVGNTFSSIEIPVDNETNLIEFLARVKEEIG